MFLKSEDSYFKKNVVKYHKDMNKLILFLCIIGGVCGILFFSAMKFLNIMTELTWNTILNFTIVTFFDLLIPSIIYFIFSQRGSNVTFTKIFKYVLVTCTVINYLSIVLLFPYKELWSVIYFVLIVSTLFLQVSVVAYGICLSTAACIISCIYVPGYFPADTSEIISRILSLGFGATASLMTAILSRKLLKKSSNNEKQLDESLSSIRNVMENVVNKAKGISEELNVSSGNISVMATQQHQAIEEIAITATSVLEGSVETAKSITETKMLIESLSNGVSEIFESTVDSISVAQDLQKSADNGIDHIADAVMKIKKIQENFIETSSRARELDSKAKGANNVIETIRQIANQTNLLSLNATIEAARAGENGRGFAVVADEIRMLAEQSNKSLESVKNALGDIQQLSSEVDEIINSSVSVMQEGVDKVQISSDIYQTIVNKLDNTIKVLDNIKNLSDKKFSESKSIQDYTEKVDKVAYKTSESVESVASATQESCSMSEEFIRYSQAINEMAKQLLETVTVKEQ